MKCGVCVYFDNNIAEGAGLDPDKQHLLRQLKAGERVLMRVQQE